ncbi:MAG: hypothetical protein U9N34_07700 [Candidatus Cloacimonadota bacterium]|nr:hypothetical protein [Candidatus Cloacimonadota bacterium]
MFSQKVLKTYDLETVVIQIDGTYYKAKPSFKKLFFTASGKKSGFGYSAGKELILVYVPYGHKIQVLGVITQGQFIQENEYTEYNIGAKKEAKKQVLHKTLELVVKNGQVI